MISEEKRERVRSLIQRRPDLSNRAIARLAGTGHPMVGEQRRTLGKPRVKAPDWDELNAWMLVGARIVRGRVYDLESSAMAVGITQERYAMAMQVADLAKRYAEALKPPQVQAPPTPAPRRQAPEDWNGMNQDRKDLDA